jgi:transcriptional regulator with XRE-family HTH domain
MVKFEVNLEKLRQQARGYAKVIAEALNISTISVSRKLNGHQWVSNDEINTIIEVLNLDARDFVFFVDTQKQVEIR